jgi:hypothetical protein
MKSRIGVCLWIALLINFIKPSLFGQNVMTVSNASGNARDTVTVNILIDNASPFVAFEVHMKLHSQTVYVHSSALLSSRAVDHTLSAGMVAGDSLRILGYSTAGTAFTGGSGSVVSFRLALKTVPGSYALVPTVAIIGDALAHNILTAKQNGQVTLLAPDVDLSVNSLAYERTVVGNVRDLSFNVSNPGNSVLTIASFTVTPNTAYSVVPGWNADIPASCSQGVTVRFAPPAKGAFPGTVKILTNDPDEPQTTVTLSGTGYKINELHVDNLSVRSDVDTALTLRINNQEPVKGFQFDLSLPSSMSFLTGSEKLTSRSNGHTVSAGMIPGRVLRVIAYSNNNASFSGSDGHIVSLRFHVEGTGGSYALPLGNALISDSTAQNVLSDSYNGNLAIAAADIQSATSIPYGAASIFDTADVSLSIQNVGDDTLHIAQFAPSDVHFWATIATPFKINPSALAVVPTHFHSAAEGQFSGHFSIRSNDPDENPYSISFSARAFSPNVMKTDDAAGNIGEDAAIYVSIDNNDPFTAFQLDIDFPSPFGVVLDSTRLTSRAQDHTLEKVHVSGNRYRFLVFSSSLKAFTGHSGPVLRIKGHISGSAGDYPVPVLDPVISNAAGQNIISGSQNGTLTVVSSVDVNFDFPQMGWYMMSLPVQPFSASVGALFPSALGGVAFIWNSEFGYYDAVTDMVPGNGYWLAIPNAVACTVSGLPFRAYTASMPQMGWYMIGSVMGNADFSSPNDVPDGQVLTPAFGWDPASGSYLPTTALNEKQGYWIAVFGACHLTVGGTGGGMGKAALLSGFPEFAGRFGTDPPPPPQTDWKTGMLAGMPGTCGLMQNYPNPFSAGGGSAFGGNPETTIEYRLPVAGHIHLAVYNTMGRMVRILADGLQDPGNVKVVWDGRSDSGQKMGAGVYLVRLQTGNIHITKKLLLVE